MLRNKTNRNDKEQSTHIADMLKNSQQMHYKYFNSEPNIKSILKIRMFMILVKTNNVINVILQKINISKLLAPRNH